MSAKKLDFQQEKDLCKKYVKGQKVSILATEFGLSKQCVHNYLKRNKIEIRKHLLDITGEIFSRLTVINRNNEYTRRGTFWNCVCECGNFTIAESAKLKAEEIKSCGCFVREQSKLELVGKKFGRLTIVSIDKKNGRCIKWLCDCECGIKISVATNSLKNGNTKSCGCLTQVYKNKNFIGMRFGRLDVIADSNKKNNGVKYVICICDCGRMKEASARSLVIGQTVSCGCYCSEITSKRLKSHGMSGTSLYSIWLNMKSRCLNEDNQSYHNYGGRGITICDRWLQGENGVHAFLCFKEDVGDRPTEKHSLDRINNDGNYEKSNVVWHTTSEQSRNKRDNVMITYKGRTECMKDWAELQEIGYGTIRSRLMKGWDVEKIFETPVKETEVLIEYDDEVNSITGWSKTTGISSYFIRKKYKAGLPLEEVFRKTT